MVRIILDEEFQRKFEKLKDPVLKKRIIRQTHKIKENPEIGKPMRYGRKSTREVYISSFRLSYSIEEEAIYILDFYHKDLQ